MKLTQSEIIQILRRRSGMNQGDFGAKAFNTSFDSGRTKVKNIELGKQVPTEADLLKMARILKTNVSALKPSPFRTPAPTPPGAAIIGSKVLDLFPGLATYLDMLNNAVKLEDMELIEYIAGKIASVLTGEAPAKAAGDH